MKMEGEQKAINTCPLKMQRNVAEVGSRVHTKSILEAEHIILQSQSEAIDAELSSSNLGRHLDEIKRNDEKSDIFDFMGKLKKYFEKRNLLDDYVYIIESISNLSSIEQ